MLYMIGKCEKKGYNSLLKLHVLVRDRSVLCFHKLTTSSLCCLTAAMCVIFSVVLWGSADMGKNQ